VVNDGEWFWNSDSLDITIDVRDDWVSYVSIVLHHPGACADTGGLTETIETHGWISADCIWRGDLCTGNSFGITAWVLFREPEDNLAQCSFTLHRANRECEACSTSHEITLTQQPTAIESRPWGVVKLRFR
jgi:hypothetical protein